ncbi:MAG: nitrite/sulfite reductase [Azospirillaceae bacterium]|nr:nitrite/sulfite reductase [Azospirillaceae bacterium]
MTHLGSESHAGVYRYDDVDRQFVFERVEQFRGQVARRLAGTLSEDEFKPLRLMNGLYHQLHGYMLRIAIPYGVLTSRQMHRLARIARIYDRGYGHFTTRQNLQFNWIKLAEAPDILRELAEVDMHAIQTSGNCVRNVTTDQFAGAAADEVVDPRVYAEIMRQWSTLNPEFSYLPRKFKIAITGSLTDRAAIEVHDVGLRAKRGPDGAVGFEVFVGGGLGRTPFIGKPLRDWLPEADLLAYLDAILRVYNQWGRRDNIYKARIKILVHELGLPALRERVEQEFAQIRGPRYRLDPEIVAAINDHFAAPPFAEAAVSVSGSLDRHPELPAFGHWLETSITAHRQPGYAGVTISLKPIGGIPGDLTADQMDAVADLAARYSFGELRVSHAQNLVLPHVREDALFDLWQALGPIGLATANVGLISDIIACPGLDYCSLANTRSIPLAQQIGARFSGPGEQQNIGDLSIKISGCINACGHHHVGNIGILGVDKHGVETFQITIGGKVGTGAALGAVIGPAVAFDQVATVVENLVAVYLEQRQAGEPFVDTVARIGTRPFSEKVYGIAA